ncbi:hypothetical protein BLNAU_4406 [Blattamonas nauphoetae]|uniref:Uncharacterized protein n=1 Tax=Blattamonas nauphoetae TaxID=2049346 RepID=A0ABQ9Y9R2_9EUKA|nr:hypothetical protein BLNAU_4406 [Blattamonas nauphoetae]
MSPHCHDQLDTTIREITVRDVAHAVVNTSSALASFSSTLLSVPTPFHIASHRHSFLPHLVAPCVTHNLQVFPSRYHLTIIAALKVRRMETTFRMARKGRLAVRQGCVIFSCCISSRLVAIPFFFTLAHQTLIADLTSPDNVSVWMVLIGEVGQ